MNGTDHKGGDVIAGVEATKQSSGATCRIASPCGLAMTTDGVRRALRIGLTGGIGSGKTTVARAFAALGAPVYYTDVRARELMESSLEIRRDLVALFGKEACIKHVIPSERGEPRDLEENLCKINRPFIASRVFADHSLLARLDAIVHPRVAEDFVKWVAAQQARYVIIESAILYESGFEGLVDVVVTVSAPTGQRVARAAARDGVAPEKIHQRMAAQLTDAEREARAEIVLPNADDDPVLPAILALHEKFSKKRCHSEAANLRAKRAITNK